eukprot:178519-Prymnesium_polylepis.1
MTRKQAKTLCFAARDESSPYVSGMGSVRSADQSAFAGCGILGRSHPGQGGDYDGSPSVKS